MREKCVERRVRAGDATGGGEVGYKAKEEKAGSAGGDSDT